MFYNFIKSSNLYTKRKKKLKKKNKKQKILNGFIVVNLPFIDIYTQLLTQYKN